MSYKSVCNEHYDFQVEGGGQTFLVHEPVTEKRTVGGQAFQIYADPYSGDPDDTEKEAFSCYACVDK